MLKQYIFTTKGRLNRLRYLKYSLAFGFAVGLVSAALQSLAATISGSEQSLLVGAVTMATSFVGFLGYVALIFRRLHDLDKPEWMTVGILIPVVNFVFSLYLLLAPGTRGYNKYGEDPLG